MQRAYLLGCLVVLGCAACADDGNTPADASLVDSGATGDAVSLVDHMKWQMLDEASDPLNHRTAEHSCALDGAIPEPDGLEIRTYLCNYAAFVQPSLAALAPGDELSLSYWHFQLRADTPGEAHVAFLIGGRIVHERTIPIPSEAQIYEEKIPIDFDAPVGTDVVIHLHNHGSNTWTISKIDRAPRS